MVLVIMITMMTIILMGFAWALDAVDGADTDSLVPSLHKVAGDIPPRIPAGWYAFNP